MVAGVGLTVVITALAVLALGKVLGEVSLADVTGSLSRTSAWRVALAMILTAACYVALSGYDRIALRSIGRPLPWRRTVLGSVAAYALSHNLGFAPVTASYARHRVYMRDGVGLADVARVVVLTGASFWLGVVLVMGICLIFVPDLVASDRWTLSHPLQAAIGLLVVDVVIVYLLLIARGWRTLGWGRWSAPLPNLRDAVVQSGISLVEMALASAVLWILIPGSTPADYALVLVAYVSAFVMVLISHAPGGAGVLETVVLIMLPTLAKSDVLSALILFRIIFHLVPLAVALAILAMHRTKVA
jgi:phosphatidylglycerol lysyltransferase